MCKMLRSTHTQGSWQASARHRGCRSRVPLALAATLLQGPPAKQQVPPSPVDPAPYRVSDSTIRDINSLHKSLLHEYDYMVQDAWVEGSIPKELRGTYFRNGPGLQVANERYKRHTFDGDGMVLSFSFDQGRVWFKNKFVRTRGFVDEQAVGRPVHRTAFTRGAADGSLLFNPFDFTLKNVANTGVLHWGGRLLALYESGLPHELDAATLETIGESTIGGQLASPVLAAHYRVMPGQQQQQQQQNWRDSSSSSSSNGAAAGRTWVGFSFNAGMGDAELKFYEFAESGSLAVPPQSYRLPGVSIAMIHDIAVTPDYYVVVAGPVNFDAPKFVTQYFTSRCSIAECLVYDPTQPTKVHLVPRPRGAAAGSAPYIMDAPPMFTFHHVNAFTSSKPSSSNGNGSTNGNGNGNGSSSKRQLVLDTVAWDEIAFENNQHNLTPAYYTGGARSHLRRFVFDLDPPKPAASADGKGSSSSSSAAANYSTGRLVSDHRLARRCVEFPCVNWDVHGEAHRHIYCVTDRVDHEVHWGPTQVIMKLTLDDPLAGTQAPLQQAADVATQLWDAGPRRLIMEPLFIPRDNAAAEDDGWVLATVHNAATGKGELVILDAQDIAAGPIATVHLQHFLPAGLHGSFDPSMVVPELQQQLGSSGEGQPSAAPTWKEPNVVRAL